MASIVCACGKPVETQPDWAGQWIACPSCKGSLYAPFPGPKPAPPLALIDGPPPTRLCGRCSETIPADATPCPFCKGDPGTLATLQVSRSAPPANDSAVLALIIGLVGYMFCGMLCPFAWAMGANYEAECRRKGIEASSTGRAAKIVGIIGTVFFIFNVLGFALWLVASCL
jgi:hypothetical protein